MMNGEICRARMLETSDMAAGAAVQYGWERDTLTTVQTAQWQVQTVYHPRSFTPLLRIDSATAGLALLHNHRTLAEKLQQEGSEGGQALRRSGCRASGGAGADAEQTGK